MFPRRRRALLWAQSWRTEARARACHKCQTSARQLGDWLSYLVLVRGAAQLTCTLASRRPD
eukprot:scaffold85229_cov63-Phaeocystis_antarctica.AAC.6